MTLRLLSLLSVLFFPAISLAATNHLQFITTYLQPGTEHPAQNYLPEFLDHLSASHVGPEFFGTIRDTLHGQQAIIDLADEVFNFKDGSLLPGTAEKLDTLGKKYLDGYTKNILAFYIADEPTNYGITQRSLETVINALKARFPGIPTYIIWDQNCFDNSPSLDKKCGTVGQRGIPPGVDWVGFDWYLRGKPEADAAKFQSSVVANVNHLKSMTSQPIVIIPDGTDEFLKDYASTDQRDTIMAQRLKLFYDYAQTEPQIIGLDNYAWADHQEVLNNVNEYVVGTRSFPVTRKLLFDYADTVREVPALQAYHPTASEKKTLLKNYRLREFLPKHGSDYDKLKGIVRWASTRWTHDGENDPKTSDPIEILKRAKGGKNFRCVEDSEITVAAATALGMPARVLGLRRADVETAESGAGHVVAEVWLKDLKKWVLVDSQTGIIPEQNKTPLNTAELMEVLRKSPEKLKLIQVDGKSTDGYLDWLKPYLYYVEFRLDQRLSEANRSPDRFLLVPTGAKIPTLFQRTPLTGRTYSVYSPLEFYPVPKAPISQ